MVDSINGVQQGYKPGSNPSLLTGFMDKVSSLLTPTLPNTNYDPTHITKTEESNNIGGFTNSSYALSDAKNRSMFEFTDFNLGAKPNNGPDTGEKFDFYV